MVPYEPGKPVTEVERELGISDSVKLASNENPLGPSPLALRAMASALGELHRYPDGGGYYVRRKLGEKLGLPIEQIVLGTGSNELIDLLTRIFLSPGDEAVVSELAFIMYRQIVQAVNGTARIVPHRQYAHDLDAMADAVTERTRIIYLANPNNPTGTIFPRKDFERFIERVPGNVLIAVDEAYFEYIDDPEYPDSSCYQESHDNIVTMRTFSKIYGLAGLRIGYAIGPAEIIEDLNRIRPPFNANTLAQVAALAALDDTEHLNRSRVANRRGLDFLQKAISGLDLETVPSWANFILVALPTDGREFFEALLREGVIVRPLAGYGLPRHVRISVGTQAENERLIHAMKRVLDRFAKEGSL